MVEHGEQAGAPNGDAAGRCQLKAPRLARGGTALSPLAALPRYAGGPGAAALQILDSPPDCRNLERVKGIEPSS